MADRTTVFSINQGKLRRQGAYARARRHGGLREHPAPAAEGAHSVASGYEPVSQILKDILGSACQVLCASQAFILVSRSPAMLEVAATHDIRPGEVMQTVLAQAAPAVRAAMREKIMTAGDLHGCVLPMREGAGEEHTPAVLCVPLDLGAQFSGVICLLRRQQPRRLSDLDLEIVQALAEQAGLAIGAASHSSALSRLQDSLSRFAPAYA